MQQDSGYVAPGGAALANGRELADPWLRVAAQIINSILLAIPMALILGREALVEWVVTGALPADAYGRAVAVTVLTATYHYVMNSFFGGTVGKLVLGLRIVDADGNEPIGPSVGFIRSAANIAPVIGVIPSSLVSGFINIALIGVGLVSLVFLFSDPERRTVMDRAANTYVVKAK